jgi:hypothetical protein
VFGSAARVAWNAGPPEACSPLARQVVLRIPPISHSTPDLPIFARDRLEQSETTCAAYSVSVSAYQLAQLNIARARGAPDSPVMAEFMATLDQINALAEATPGYVWRLQTDDGNATAYRAFDDERLLLNLTVWETVEALAEFVYRSKHVEVMRRRADWFERMPDAYLVLWWVPAGHHPTVAEAEDRLRHLRTQGPTRHAFTIRRTFPPSGDTDQPDDAMIDNRWACPAG